MKGPTLVVLAATLLLFGGSACRKAGPCEAPDPIFPALSPKLQPKDGLTNVSDISSIAAGGLFTCFAIQNETIQCFGRGWKINGSTRKIPDLPLPRTKEDRTIISVKAGWQHFCVHSESGSLQCIGDSSSYKLSSEAQEKYFDASIDSVHFHARNVLQFAVGSGHFCYVSKPHELKCFGSSQFGALSPDLNVDTDSQPILTESRQPILNVVAGSKFTCIQNSPFSVRCWGQPIALGSSWSPGKSAVSDSLMQIPETFHIPSRIESLHAGRDSLCIKTKGQSLFCFGDSKLSGQTDVGTTDMALRLPKNHGQIKDVQIGLNYACTIFADGAVTCWGCGGLGQLGLRPSQPEYPVPCDKAKPIPLSDSATQISVGPYHSCALLRGGRAQCWGTNSGTALPLR